jgi:hypothetical protein
MNMIEVMTESSGRVVGHRVHGTVLHEHYQQIVPTLVSMIEEYGSIRCLVELTGFRRIGFRAVWDEIVFDLRYAGKIERLAIVGNSPWQAWLTVACRPIFPRIRKRYFDRANLDEAWRWINEGL